MKRFGYVSLASFAIAVGCGGDPQLLAQRRSATVQPAAAPSDGARAELKGYIEEVAQADAWRYGVSDDVGHTMDTAKIIADPAGGYIAVYHTNVGGQFKVNVATSNDFMNWTWVRELAGSNTGSASQPTIKGSGSAFVMAWEQEPSNHVKFVYFNSRDDLMNGVVAKSYDAPMVFSVCANGTPNLYSASNASVDFGFHYFSNCDVDRQARGSMNWRSSKATKQTNVDNAILYWGVQGNIGGRDGYFNFRGYNFGLIEGQYTKGDFGSWRSFIYDYQTGNAEPLNITTHGGSTAFANPKFTSMQIDGQWAVVVSLFIPSEGAAPGEAGQLIYYRKY
jgi:hypothetical protein